MNFGWIYYANMLSLRGIITTANRLMSNNEV